jgi:hypothetical protein
VDQRRRLQGLAGRQGGHAGAGEPVQLLVDGRQQPLRRAGVAGPRGLQQSRDGCGLVRIGRHGWQSEKKVGAV